MRLPRLALKGSAPCLEIRLQADGDDYRLLILANEI
jgi:hypothetical protein